MFQSYLEYINELNVGYLGIKQTNVFNTQQNLLESIKKLFHIKNEDIAFIGSAGKKNKNEFSHNINVVINKNELLSKNNLDKSDLYDFIKKQFNRIKIEIQIDEKNNTIIFNWPIQNSRNKEVQIRITLTENIDWIKWSRYSPLEQKESKYTGKHRQALLTAVTESVKKEVTQYFNDQDLVKEYEQYLFNPEEGLFVIQKTFEGKNGLLKKAINLQEAKRLITTNPDEFSKLIFGDDVKANNLMTFESILSYIKSNKFPYPKKRNKIFEKLKKKCFEMSLSIPEY